MLLETILSILICMLYCIAALCLGALIIRLAARAKYAAADEDRLAVFTTAFLLGQGLLAAIWQLQALGGWFSLPVIIGGLALSFLASVRFALHIAAGMWRTAVAALREYRREPPLWLAVFASTTLLILMTGISTLNPPQPRGDSLAFYMALPKVISASQQLLPLPGYEAFTQIGLQGELHFAALISLNGGVAAKMFMWPMSLAVAAMLVSIGGKVGLGRRGKWIALATIFTSTAFTSSIWNGKVDLFSAAMGLLALRWSLEVGKGPVGELTRLARLAAGLAIAAKITYLIPLVPGLLLIFIWRLRASRGQEPLFGKAFLSAAWRAVFWLGLWTALAFLPNVIKNTVLFGQPLAPLFNPEETTKWMQAWYTPATTGKILLTYPFSLVYGRYWGQGGQISPLLLAFLPMALFLPRPREWKESKLVPVALAGLVGIVLWHLYSPSAFAPRNMLASVLLLVLPGIRGVEVILDRKSGSRLLLGAVAGSVLVALMIGIMGITNITKTGILRAIGRVSLCDMETYGSDATCRIAERINEEARPEERIFLAAYYRYWFRPDIIQCVNSTEETEALDAIAEAEEAWSYLHEHGYRYVVIDEITHGNAFDLLEIDRIPEWMNVETVFEDWPFVAYRIESTDPSSSPTYICSQVDPPAWEVISVDNR
jgi:hypothetical protein